MPIRWHIALIFSQYIQLDGMNRKDNNEAIFITGCSNYSIRLYKSKSHIVNGSFFNHLQYL